MLCFMSFLAFAIFVFSLCNDFDADDHFKFGTVDGNNSIKVCIIVTKTV